MVKKCSIEREKKRLKLNSKYCNKYLNVKYNLKKLINCDLDYYKFFVKLQSFPRNSNSTRIRNRCLLTGRPRGTFRRFGLSRFLIRKLAFDGYIPGIVKSSW